MVPQLKRVFFFLIVTSSVYALIRRFASHHGLASEFVVRLRRDVVQATLPDDLDSLSDFNDALQKLSSLEERLLKVGFLSSASVPDWSDGGKCHTWFAEKRCDWVMSTVRSLASRKIRDNVVFVGGDDCLEDAEDLFSSSGATFTARFQKMQVGRFGYRARTMDMKITKYVPEMDQTQRSMKSRKSCCLSKEKS
jgi:hypothetical protein